MRVRSLLFWIHLLAGVLCGVIIAILCFTGAVLAFEKELVAWSERDARRVPPPAQATPLRIEDLVQRAGTAAGRDRRPSSIVVYSDARAAAAVSFGREATYYVNPYTGHVQEPASTRMHDFMHAVEDWHRWLALGGDNRPAGKLVTGISNAAFLLLAASGIILWWPRRWSWRAVKPSVWFAPGARGKARDWNWHNVVGIWTAPILIVLTLTAIPISFRWASNGIYRLWGEQPPVQGGPGPQGGTPPAITPPTPDASPRPLQDLVHPLLANHPDWISATVRLTPGREGGRPGAPAVSVVVRTHSQGPFFATTQYSLNPYNGDIVRAEAFAEGSPARQTRTWMRFLHTGEALGWPGQALAGLASMGGVLLVYTGLALSWRRFFHRPKASAPTTRVDLGRTNRTVG